MRERDLKTIKAEDIERVRKSFKSKLVAVKDSLVRELLSDNSADDVCNAIRATNFDQACNPINVIRWMLREGSFCVPLGPASPEEALEPLETPDDDERESVKQLIREAKSNLLRRTS